MVNGNFKAWMEMCTKPFIHFMDNSFVELCEIIIQMIMWALMILII